MTAAPRLHVLAPVHNRRAVTEKFIGCLLAQTYRNWHLILIDDGSTDGTEAMARSLVPPTDLTVLTGKGNWWWAGSLHQGYLWMKANAVPADDLVLTMNDDTVFGPEFLANAVAAIKPRSLLQAICLDKEGRLDEVGVQWDWRTLLSWGVKTMENVNCFSTRGLFLHAGDFVELGGFHPVLLPHYLSDYEFTMRAHRRGFAMTSAPNVLLRFDDDPSLTGIRSVEGLPILQRLRRNLSIRSTANPIYWSSFVLLGSPWRYLPLNLYRVWWRYFAPVTDRIRLFFRPLTRLIALLRAFLGRVKRKIQREWAARNGAVQ